MKKVISIFLLGLVWGLSLIELTSCKKDTEVNTDKFEIDKQKEKVTVESTAVTISGVFSYLGKVNSIEVEYAENEALLSSTMAAASIDGKNYSVKIISVH